MRKVNCLILIVLVLLVMGCARQGEGETAVTTELAVPSSGVLAIVRFPLG